MITNQKQDNYSAKIIRVEDVFDIEGADRIKSIIVDYSSVVVGSDVKKGDIRIYFPPESQLSDRLIRTINEYRETHMNENPELPGGFFESNRRVKVLKLRGVKSNGYTIPAKQFAEVYDIPLSLLEENVGMMFDTINGEFVCNKYIVPMTKAQRIRANSAPKKRAFERLVEGQFNFHVSTSNLRVNMSQIALDDHIVISNKLHGSSWIVSNVLVKRSLNWIERIAQRLGINVPATEYDHLAASRTVVRNRYLDPKTEVSEGFYGKDWWVPFKDTIKHRVPKGYTLYGEMVGYVMGTETPIQKCKTGAYDYGCIPAEYKTIVYRVTLTNPDGIVLELSTRQVEQFCKQYGFEMAEKYFDGTVREFLTLHNIDEKTHWQANFIKKLEELYNEKDCHLCTFHKVPEEGIVVRIDNKPFFEAYKLKSFRFLFETEKANNDAGETNIEDNA